MSFLSSAEAVFVEKAFREFYRENYRVLYLPDRIQEREFGYFTFSGKLMVRHLAFGSPRELWETVRRVTPLHLHYSAAFYRYPKAPMEEKEWLGAELIFDIDADHLDTPCGKRHDFKVCPKCREAFPLDAENCPRCGGQLRKVEWVCGECLEAAREEARKLLDFLEGDLGFRKLRMAFSGNRGFHLVVHDEQVLDLGQAERKEIVDYLTGAGLELRALGLDGRRVDPELAPDIGDPGWRGRVARAALQLAARADGGELYRLTGDRRALRLGEELRRLAEAWGEKPGWSVLSRSSRALLVKAAVELSAAHIDAVVTTDIHRLLRLGNSLHGKTGLLARTFNPNTLDDFDPFTQALALPTDREAEIYVIKAPRFRLGEGEYGPYKAETVRLPLAAAVYLLARGAAALP